MTALVEPTGLAAHARAGARFAALVVIADPDRRRGVVRLLTGLGARGVAEAASLAEARVRTTGMPGQQGRDFCVLDLALPDGSGLALLAELRAAGWARGLVLSAHDDPYTVRAALSAGVRCFLVDRGATEPAGPVRRGQGVRSSGLDRPPAGPDGLSAREIEVLRLVGDGHTNRDIGVQLGLSALTVKSHLARIARKLGTGDRAEMVVVALRAGVIA